MVKNVVLKMKQQTRHPFGTTVDHPIRNPHGNVIILNRFLGHGLTIIGKARCDDIHEHHIFDLSPFPALFLKERLKLIEPLT